MTNLELVRSICAAWERGEIFGSSDWAHPDIEFVATGGNEAGTWTGLTELAKTTRDRLSVWENAYARAEQYREVGHERVLVFFTPGGRGKISGLMMEQLPAKGAFLFQIRGGKVTRLVLYWDREQALADVGLSNETDSPDQ